MHDFLLHEKHKHPARQDLFAEHTKHTHWNTNKSLLTFCSSCSKLQSRAQSVGTTAVNCRGSFLSLAQIFSFSLFTFLKQYFWIRKQISDRLVKRHHNFDFQNKREYVKVTIWLHCRSIFTLFIFKILNLAWQQPSFSAVFLPRWKTYSRSEAPNKFIFAKYEVNHQTEKCTHLTLRNKEGVKSHPCVYSVHTDLSTSPASPWVPRSCWYNLPLATLFPGLSTFPLCCFRITPL